MPILRGAATFSRFRAEHAAERPRDERHWLAKGLRLRAFTPIDRKGEDERSAGFVELENHEGVEFAPSNFIFGEHALFAWRVDRLKIPNPAVNAELEKWKQAFEKDQSRPPRRFEAAEARSDIRRAMRGKSTPSSRFIDVSWNFKSGELFVWSSARKSIEELQEALEKCFGLRLTALSAASVAEQMGVPEAAIGPTPQLAGLDLSEVRDG